MANKRKSGQFVGPSAGASTALASVAGTPTFVSNATGSISITWSENSNADVCDYLIYVEATGSPAGYVQANGTVAAGEVWQTFAVWGASVTVTGLTIYTVYKFKVKTRDEADAEVAYSSLSASMNTLPSLDAGPTSDNLEREVTGGDTRIYGDPTWTGSLADAAISNIYYGDILFTYLMQNEGSETSSLWSTVAGAAGVDFSEDYSPITEVGTWYAATMGAGGAGITGLTSSPAGVSHIYSLDSYLSCGKSKYKTAVYLRLTPKDGDGDAGTAVIVGPFGVNNLPAEMTWVNADGFAWNKDTTPTWSAVTVSLRSGTRGFPAVHYYREEDGTGAIAHKYSYQCIDGWEYETSAGVWVALTVAGILEAYCGIGLHVRYTPTTALATGNYIVTGEMWETRDLG